MKCLTITLSLVLLTHYVSSQTKKRTTVERLPINKEIMFNPSTCEQSYYSIKLSGFDIGLENDKSYWAKYEPILFVEIETDDQKFYRIFGAEAGAKSNDPKNDNGFRTSQNILLIGPYPFKGDNSVKIKVALYATKVEDKIQNVIGAITPITKVIGGQFEIYSKITTGIANHVSGLLSNYKPLVSFEGEWNPYNGNKTDKSVFRSGYFIVHSIEDQSKFSYDKVKIGDDGQILYSENTKNGYLFEKNVDYAILEFEHQLYRTDLKTSKFAFKGYLEDATKYATEKDTVRMEIAFDKFRHSLMDEAAFTNHDKIRIILENYSDLISQIKTKYPKYYNEKNIVVPYCMTGLYQSFTPQKILAEMAIRKSLIENGIIFAGESVDSSQYGALLAQLPKTSKQEVLKQLKAIDIQADANTLISIDNIIGKIEDLILDDKSILNLKTISTIDITNGVAINKQQQQTFENKINQIQQQQQQERTD